MLKASYAERKFFSELVCEVPDMRKSEGAYNHISGSSTCLDSNFLQRGMFDGRKGWTLKLLGVFEFPVTEGTAECVREAKYPKAGKLGQNLLNEFGALMRRPDVDSWVYFEDRKCFAEAVGNVFMWKTA